MAVTGKVLIEVTHNDGKIYKSLQADLFSKPSAPDQLNAIRRYFRQIAGGTAGNATFTVNVNDGAATKGSQTYTISGTVAADDQVTIAGIALTAKASPSGIAQFQASTTKQTAANALVACINAHTTLCNVVYATTTVATNPVVTVTALTSNTGTGAGITTVKNTGASIAVGGAALGSGTNDTNGVTTKSLTVG